MSLSAAQLGELGRRLWQSVAGGDFFPPWLAGIDYDDALALQLEILRHHQAAGGVLAGWKVGLTSARARAMFGGIDVRPFGYLDAAHTFASGATVPTLGIVKPAIETELCFTVGQRLIGRDLSPAAVRDAMASVAAGYELNMRNPGTLKPDLTLSATARMSNWAIVYGRGVAADALDLAGVRVRMNRTVPGGEPETVLDERAGDHVDDHFVSIGLLARALADYDLALEPGQKIITGAVGRFPVEPGQTWRSEFSGVGTVEVQFT